MATRTKRVGPVDSDGNPLRKTPPQLQEGEERNYDPKHTDKVVNSAAGKYVVQFIDHDEGFLKIRRAMDSDDLHLTWTWSMGKHAGRYVYVRVLYWQLAYGLELLYTKLHEVELGIRMATPDKLGHWK